MGQWVLGLREDKLPTGPRFLRVPSFRGDGPSGVKPEKTGKNEESMPGTELGQLIKDARMAAGIPHHEFADALGVTEGELHLWEFGKKQPSVPLSKIIECLPDNEVTQKLAGYDKRIARPTKDTTDNGCRDDENDGKRDNPLQ